MFFNLILARRGMHVGMRMSFVGMRMGFVGRRNVNGMAAGSGNVNGMAARNDNLPLTALISSRYCIM
jgi:hypothetical protein